MSVPENRCHALTLKSLVLNAANILLRRAILIFVGTTFSNDLCDKRSTQSCCLVLKCLIFSLSLRLCPKVVVNQVVCFCFCSFAVVVSFCFVFKPGWSVQSEKHLLREF